jgi:hypothetical protein
MGPVTVRGVAIEWNGKTTAGVSRGAETGLLPIRQLSLS